MPSGRSAASTTTIEPTRSRRMVASTSRSGVCGAHHTAGRRSTLFSGASIPARSITASPASARSRFCERASSIARWSVQKARNTALSSRRAWKSAPRSSQQKVSACAR